MLRPVALLVLMLGYVGSAWAIRPTVDFTVPVNTETDTRMQVCPRIIQEIADISVTEGDTIGPFDLKLFAIAGDDDVTNSPVAPNDVNPTIVASGDAIDNQVLDTSDLDNATFTAVTDTSSAATGDLVLTWGNDIPGCADAVMTIHFVVADSATPSTDIEIPQDGHNFFIASVGGNNSNSGTTVTPGGSGPWQTPEKINGLPACGGGASPPCLTAGDRIWFKAGDIYDLTTTVTVSDVNANGVSSVVPFVIGSYYLNASGAPVENRPADWDDPTLYYSERVYAHPPPVLRGSYREACRYANNCSYYPAGASVPPGAPNFGPWGIVGVGAAVPASYAGALLFIDGSHDLIVQDLVLVDSAGIGLKIDNASCFGVSSDTPECTTNIIAQRLWVHNAATAEINLAHVSNVVVRDSRIALGGLAAADVIPKPPGGATGIFGGGCLPCNYLIEGNEHENTWGGYTEFYVASHILIRGAKGANSNKLAFTGGRSSHMIYEESTAVGGGTVDPPSGCSEATPYPSATCQYGKYENGMGSLGQFSQENEGQNGPGTYGVPNGQKLVRRNDRMAVYGATTLKDNPSCFFGSAGAAGGNPGGDLTTPSQYSVLDVGNTCAWSPRSGPGYNYAGTTAARVTGVENANNLYIVAEQRSSLTCPPYSNTSLSAARVTGNTSLAVADISGFSNGQSIKVEIDTGAWHTTTVSGAPVVTSAPAGTIVLAAGLPSNAASGSRVVVVSAFDFHHNFWKNTAGAYAPPERCQGAGDVNSATTGMGAFDFDAASWTNYPTDEDWSVDTNFPGKTAGVAMTDTYLDKTQWTWVLGKRKWMPACNVDGMMTDDQWAMKLYSDACENERDVNTMGALNWTNTYP